MAAARFVDALNDQIANEFGAHQQYAAIAVHFDALTLPRLAALFYRQALDERDHAMMMVRYLLDADARVRMPGVAEPRSEFSDLVAPVELALAQERRVTEQISGLTAIAREEGDYASEQFMQWFIKEQVEEVATMSSLLAVVQRAANDADRVEEYILREIPARAAADATAPPVAGAGVTQ